MSSKLGRGCKKGALGNDSGGSAGVSNECIHMLRSVRGEASAWRLNGFTISGDTDDVSFTGRKGAIGGRCAGGTAPDLLTGGGGMEPSIETDEDRFFALL